MDSLPVRRSVPARLRPLLAACLAAGLFCPAAQAGLTYRLDRAQAAPGETVRIEGVLFNDGDSVADWTAPAQLILQWRGADGSVVRTLAYLDTASPSLSVPVNNFAKVAWQAVVPPGARGLQALAIEGEPVMMALDAGGGAPAVAAAPADAPVIDAGRPGGPPGTGEPLPPAAVAQASAAPPAAAGAAAAEASGERVARANGSAFDRFRNNISAYEPIYFDAGNRGGANARFQISFKYRLFTPDDPQDPGFFDRIYLGYTQTALWDLAGDSRPFVDTTYNPSLFWHSDRLWESSGQRWFMGLTSGVGHSSNGKDGDDSRSVNEVFLEPAVNYRFDHGSTLSFAPRFRKYFAPGSDNRDYADYAGHVDWKLRWAQDDGLVLSALYRQGDSGRRATQLEAAWPLSRTFLRMNGYLHVQYFNGYGETLLGYNQRNDSQVRIGLSLVP